MADLCLLVEADCKVSETMNQSSLPGARVAQTLRLCRINPIVKCVWLRTISSRQSFFTEDLVNALVNGKSACAMYR
jgi:hypothetical protein